MDTKSILSDIAKLKNAIDKQTNPDIKAKFENKLKQLEAQLAEAEEKIEKKEEKADAQEKKEQSKAEEDIKKLEAAIAKQTNPEIKEKFKKKLAELKDSIKETKEETKEQKKEIEQEKKDIKEAAKEVEKIAKKVEVAEKKEEDKNISDAEEKINKLEKAIAKETDEDVKKKYQKKLKELKESVSEIKEESKEERKKPIRKVKPEKKVRKTPIKKVAATPAPKKAAPKKEERKKKLKGVLAELDALIEKNKRLKAKYGSAYKGTGKPSDLERDSKRKAKPFGYRFVGKHDYRVPTEMQIKRGLKRGTIDYEARPNRADVSVKRKVKLEDGGNIMAGGGKLKFTTMTEDSFLEKYGHRKNVYPQSVKNTFDIIHFGSEKKERMQGFLSAMKMNGYKVQLSSDGEFAVAVRKRNIMEDGGMMANGGMAGKPEWVEPEWLVMIKSEEGDTHEWQGFAKDEDEALHKAEQDAGFESVESGIVMVTDENGEAVEFKKGGKTKEGRMPHHYADGGMAGKREWVVEIHSKNGDIHTWQGLASTEDLALEKAEEEAGFESVESSVVMITDKYGRSVEIEYGKGGKTKEKWIQDALAGKKGVLRATATRKGLLRGEDDKLSKTDLKKLQKMGGKTAKRAHLAETLSKFKKGGKVGYSAEDKARFAKPAGWRWKEEALKRGKITRSDLAKSPSKYMRDKYPDLVYYENRLNKSDKKPTRTSAPSV